MSKFGEFLMLLGTILFITVGFMINILTGMIVSAIFSFLWGVIFLRLASLIPPKGGDKQ